MVNRLTLPLADWVGISSLAHASDVQLLHRFARAGEQQAFAMLVKRHGPMVWGVTRRLLRSHQDAEDAFQASFLVLARKAATLRQPQLLTNWLHGVAHRTALHLRSRQKFAVPLEAEHEPADNTLDQLAWPECGTLIDQAIEELPTALRIVFLLCQAESLTTLAASKRLNIPEGTVVSRLHRARKQLQHLLARHGITSAAGAVVAGWSLTLPETLSALTVRSLLGSAPSALVAGLAQGVLTTMLWIKLTTAAVIVSTLGLVGAGATTMITQNPGDKVVYQPGTGQPPAKSESKDERIKTLMRELEVLQRQVDLFQGQERSIRQILEAEKQKSEEVRRFLEQNPGFTQAAKNHEADMLAKKEVERRAMAQAEEDMRAKKQAEQQHLQMKQAQEYRERRTVDLMKAKEQLTQEIEQLQNDYTKMEKQHQQALGVQQQFDQRLDITNQELEKEYRQAEKSLGSDSDKMKELKARRDAMLAEASKRNVLMVQMKSTTMVMTRLHAQLQLREKLLLEVDEKLLRMQLNLDGK